MKFRTHRRGLRAIITRGEVGSDGRILLGLECGHTVSRSNGGHREYAKSAVCPTCKRIDGAATDAKRAALAKGAA